MNPHKIPELFGIDAKAKISPLKKGHINKTFLVECNGKRYVLQSLNKTVFRCPETVMSNISKIENAFEKSGERSVAVPHYLTANGRNFVTDCDGFWRMYEYIRCEAPPQCSGSRHYLAGRSFGTFIKITEHEKLSTVIENFHDFDSYFEKLVNLNKSSSKGKIDGFIMKKLRELKIIFSEIFTPDLIQRNIHGDAKLDNVLTGAPCTVIDLDTAMAGFAAVDFGDLVRSSCKAISPNIIETIKNISAGFAEGIGEILTVPEINSLYYGILYVTGELAVRYFISYLSEDNYFSGKTPADCLNRACELMEQLVMFRSHDKEIIDIIFSAFSVQNGGL
jgi:hypothetical protein rflaF_19478